MRYRAFDECRWGSRPECQKQNRKSQAAWYWLIYSTQIVPISARVIHVSLFYVCSWWMTAPLPTSGFSTMEQVIRSTSTCRKLWMLVRNDHPDRSHMIDSTVNLSRDHSKGAYARMPYKTMRLYLDPPLLLLLWWVFFQDLIILSIPNLQLEASNGWRCRVLCASHMSVRKRGLMKAAKNSSRRRHRS